MPSAVPPPPWAIGLLETRGSTLPTVLRYVDAILGSLRSAGFSTEDAAHASWLLDAYVYGHVLQERSLRIDASQERGSAATEATGGGASGGDIPNLAEVAAPARTSGAFSFDGEFAFGLELILEALDRHTHGGTR